jgi:hypothetical protein
VLRLPRNTYLRSEARSESAAVSGAKLLRKKVRESSQRFGAQQARSGTQAHKVDGLGSGELGAFRYEWAFPLLLPRPCAWPLSSPYSPSITRAFVLIRPICS